MKTQNNPKKILYYIFLTFGPIISVLLLVLFSKTKEELQLSFDFSILRHYYIPLIILGLIIFLYLSLVFYSKNYYEDSYYKIISSIYLLLSIAILIANANMLFGVNIHIYENLDLFLVFNTAVYLFLLVARKL